MSPNDFDRRGFLKCLLGSLSLAAFDWSAFPRRSIARAADDEFDAIVIGSGLGGLSCAAAFARQGFHPLVIEKHDRAGGYATSFARPGGFLFDVSLHSTGIEERNGLHNLISGFPEITTVDFVPHPNLYRAVFPEHDIRVPQKNVQSYIDLLTGQFPAEAEGIRNLFADMQGVADDISRLSAAGGQVDMSRFPSDFPHLFRNFARTWGQMMDEWIKDPKLRAVVSAQWGYYGLPPSKLAALYYALPAMSYLADGGYYPRGRSQDISNAFVAYIEKTGGRVLLGTAVDKILVNESGAYAVRTKDGAVRRARVVVSNANAYDTVHSMLEGTEPPAEYLARLDKYSVSLASFQVFLGLKKDLVRKIGIPDSELMIAAGYDDEASYEAARKADIENCGYGLSLYDNILPDYSPAGKNTINIIALMGYEPWEKYAPDYWRGEKSAYRAEKERLARALIEKVEKAFLPGLTEAIEVMEVATPLTNVRYTGNYRGAIYGYDQTIDNCGNTRLPHETPIKNLYLAGAWTRPGHGYGTVIWSGLECFGEIMKGW